MSRWQLENAFKEGFGQCRKLKAEILFKCFAVKFAMIRGVFKNTFYFAGEDKLTLLLCVVKRLNAKEIARAEKLVFTSVPKGKSEHASQAFQHVFSPLQIAHE